ncbi:MAG: helix-turn-helix transcriptional regulator [Candidatus Aminicenantes bacterium]|nr:MAG: helix-turn-helix transcriptional regulator [Candidatus Aminicenantes bacterium]
MKLLSRIEEIILLSIWRLGDRAYGMAIREEVIRVTGKKWLLGAIYGPLGRLHKNGYVLTSRGEPTSERGGRSKVFYRLSQEGIKALREIQQVNSIIWNDIEELEFKEE